MNILNNFFNLSMRIKKQGQITCQCKVERIKGNITRVHKMPQRCSKMYVLFTKSYVKERHKNFRVFDYFSKINANSLGNTDRERSPLSLGSDRTSLRVHTI